MVKIFIVVTGLFMMSCSTLFNERTMFVKVKSTSDSLKFTVNNDTSQYFTTPCVIEANRSKEPLVINTISNNSLVDYSIKSSLSERFWWGNIFATYFVGFIVDFTNQKRFSYPTEVTINPLQYNYTASYKTKGNWKYFMPKKDYVTVKFTIPEGNLLYLNKGTNYGNAAGFLGASLGFEYYFTDKYCINSDFGAVTDFFLPLPAPFDYEGVYSRSVAFYSDLQLGRDFGRFHVDCGLQLSQTDYIERETVELLPDYIDTLRYSFSQLNMGLAFSSYYRITKGFHIGINYYPSFINWHKGKQTHHYSHILFFELIFKMNAYRPRKSYKIHPEASGQ